jgi:hypothetical protein
MGASQPQGEFLTVQIEAAQNGWVVRCVPPKGVPPKVFVRWESVVTYAASLLTTNPQNDRGLS